MTDIDLDAPPPITRREMLRKAWAALDIIVRHALDQGLKPDRLDCKNIRRAHELLTVVLKEPKP